MSVAVATEELLTRAQPSESPKPRGLLCRSVKYSKVLAPCLGDRPLLHNHYLLQLLQKPTTGQKQSRGDFAAYCGDIAECCLGSRRGAVDSMHLPVSPDGFRLTGDQIANYTGQQNRIQCRNPVADYRNCVTDRGSSRRFCVHSSQIAPL